MKTDSVHPLAMLNTAVQCLSTWTSQVLSMIFSARGRNFFSVVPSLPSRFRTSIPVDWNWRHGLHLSWKQKIGDSAVHTSAEVTMHKGSRLWISRNIPNPHLSRSNSNSHDLAPISSSRSFSVGSQRFRAYTLLPQGTTPCD